MAITGLNGNRRQPAVDGHWLRDQIEAKRALRKWEKHWKIKQTLVSCVKSVCVYRTESANDDNEDNDLMGSEEKNTRLWWLLCEMWCREWIGCDWRLWRDNTRKGMRKAFARQPSDRRQRRWDWVRESRVKAMSFRAKNLLFFPNQLSLSSEWKTINKLFCCCCLSVAKTMISRRPMKRTLSGHSTENNDLRQTVSYFLKMIFVWMSSTVSDVRENTRWMFQCLSQSLRSFVLSFLLLLFLVVRQNGKQELRPNVLFILTVVSETRELTPEIVRDSKCLSNRRTNQIK